jgi:hypothetical protein
LVSEVRQQGWIGLETPFQLIDVTRTVANCTCTGQPGGAIWLRGVAEATALLRATEYGTVA